MGLLNPSSRRRNASSGLATAKMDPALLFECAGDHYTAAAIGTVLYNHKYAVPRCNGTNLPEIVKKVIQRDFHTGESLEFINFRSWIG